MEKSTAIIAFAIVILVVVGAVVFMSGNNPSQQPLNVTNKTSNQIVINSTNLTKESVISSSELANHSAKLDCWISYKGSVYDVTSWLPKHPGSSKAIEPYCGTSSSFEEAFIRQHGTTKASMLMQVGRFMGYFEKVGALS